MGTKQSAVKTPLTRAGGLERMVWSIAKRTGEAPPEAAAVLTTVQWCLETANGTRMFNHAPCGVKGDPLDPEHDHVYLTTHERLPKSQAASWKKDPRVTHVRYEGAFEVVKVSPDHPACCFRSYVDFEQGFDDYVSLLVRRYGSAWSILFQPGCTARAFATELKKRGYFTSELDDYATGLERLYKEVRPLWIAYCDEAKQPPAVDEDRELFARTSALLAQTVLYGPRVSTIDIGD